MAKKDKVKVIKVAEEKHCDHFQKLSNDHVEFKQLFQDVKQSTAQIEHYSQAGNRILEKFHQDNIEYMKILAGKKQVPLSIFSVVVVLLCVLLIASEARYSGLDIEVNSNGVKIIRAKK